MTATIAPATDTRGPLELFDIDRLLTPTNDIAATVRRFVDTWLRPDVAGVVRITTCQRMAKEFGDLGLPRHAPDRLRLRGHQRCRQLRSGLSRARSR